MIAVVVGHDANHQGAVAVDGTSEWLWNRPLAEQVVAELEALGRAGQVFYRPQFGRYAEKMAELVDEIHAAGVRVVVELHFNSLELVAGGPRPQHTLVVHWPGSRNGARLADELARRVADAIGPGRERQARGQARNAAGAPLLILQLTDVPAVILEPHFGCVASDHAAATAARDSGRLAQAIALALHTFLGGGPDA